MNHHPVKSSRIASVGYDETSSTLEIRFHRTGTLQYLGVRRVFFVIFLSWFLKAAFMTA